MFVRIGLYATREYIARHGALETLDDMKNHRLIFQTKVTTSLPTKPCQRIDDV